MYNRVVNKKVILVIAALVVLGIIGFFVFGKKSANPLPVPTSQESTQSANQNQPSSLKDLLSKGIAQTCTFTNDTTQGTVMVSAGKMRGDFAVTTDGKTTQSHMIVDGTTSYIWTEGQTTGFKMAFNPEATAQPAAPGAAPAGGINTDQKLDYTCNPGVADSSVFNLPAGINFMEFAIPTTAPSGQPASAAGGSTSAQWSACNSLPAAAKAQCLTALHCE